MDDLDAALRHALETALERRYSLMRALVCRMLELNHAPGTFTLIDEVHLHGARSLPVTVYARDDPFTSTPIDPRWEEVLPPDQDFWAGIAAYERQVADQLEVRL